MPPANAKNTLQAADMRGFQCLNVSSIRDPALTSIQYKSLSKEILARYRSMQYGVNRGGDCRAEFLLKIHIRNCQVSRGLSSFPDKT